MKDLLLIIPVYNEEDKIAQSIDTLASFFRKHPFQGVRIQIAVAGRANTDGTNAVVAKVAKKHKEVSHTMIDFPTKGGRIMKVARGIYADYYAFIDCDLPIELKRFRNIINGVLEGADISVASKYIPGAGQRRPPKRVITSVAYNWLVRILLPEIKTHDMCAGAKAWNRKVVRRIFPTIRSTSYFFDTEIIFKCFKRRYRVLEVPVVYEDLCTDSKVNVLKDSYQMGRDLLKFTIAWRLGFR